MKTRLIALALAAGASTLCARAAEGPPVYRCGNTYQQAPCAGGKALDADDARSPAQIAAARDVAAQDRRLADAMTRDRERQESLVKPGLATAIGSAPAPQMAVPAHKTLRSTSRRLGRHGTAGEFVATGRRSGSTKSSGPTRVD